MSSVDSKFTKSLQIHTLQNLVFEKRQRKTVQQSPPLFTKTTQMTNKPKKVSNKITKTLKQKNLKQQTKTRQKPTEPQKKSKLIKKRNYLTSKDLSRNRNSSALKLKEQKQTKLNKNYQLPTLQQKKQIEEKSSMKKNEQKNLKSNKTQRNNLPKDVKSDQKFSTQKQSESIIKKLNIQQPQIQYIQEKIIQKKIGRPKKIVQSIETQKKQNLEESQNIHKNNEQKSPIKSRALQNLLQSDSKKSIKQCQQTPRPRQAKLNALKRYTEKQLYPEDSQEFEKGFSSKKKRITKISQSNPYSINRIFRKQAKLDLNPINIDVKLNKLSLNAFRQKFGTFDVIHSSLPLSMIWELSEIENLMVKGFIFIWVQKGQIPLAYHLMNRLGYDVIDQIVWVKSDELTRVVYNELLTQQEPYFSQDNLFLNSKSVCFVGYKCPTGQKAEYRTKISNNLIFAPPSERNPLKKPDEIFQIADLLMPGSRKLELGGCQQKGWLSLHHTETRLRKCFKCLCDLSGKGGKLFRNEFSNNLSSICESCYLISQKQKQEQALQSESEQQEESIQIPEQVIKIKQIEYLDYEILNHCPRCLKTSCEEFVSCSCLNQKQKEHFMCTGTYVFNQECFYQEFNDHSTHQVDSIKIRKSVFVNEILLSCSSCQKKTIVSHYYECISSNCRNKNHLYCQQCFWKSGYDMIQNPNSKIQNTKKKNDGLHEWKLKKVTSFPQEKIPCSCSCKNDMSLPYFVCQTCVGWRWCGKCKMTSSQTHSHKIDNEGALDISHKLAMIS